MMRLSTCITALLGLLAITVQQAMGQPATLTVKYTKIDPNVDFPENNIINPFKVENISACESACTINAECDGYVFYNAQFNGMDAGTCLIKSSMTYPTKIFSYEAGDGGGIAGPVIVQAYEKAYDMEYVAMNKRALDPT